jgi:putative hydrolase of the HAD superfamily
MKHYRHLFFDLDNTLWDFETNSYHALESAFQQLGLHEKLPSFDDYFKIYYRINHHLWELYRNREITKEKLIVKRFEDSLQEYGLPQPGKGKEINEEYLSQMPLKTQLVEGAREVLEALHKKYKLHIITNGFREVQHQKLANSQLEHFFDKVFISEVIGAPKPNREIFEHALKSTNARKQESLMIGDSWEADIKGALEFGIDQVFLSNDFTDYVPQIKERPNTREIENTKGDYIQLTNGNYSTYFIHQLSELVNILI